MRLIYVFHIILRVIFGMEQLANHVLAEDCEVNNDFQAAM